LIQETSEKKLFHLISTEAQQILLSRLNEEAQHKLNLSRITISEFLDLKFGPYCLILKAVIYGYKDLELISSRWSYCVCTP